MKNHNWIVLVFFITSAGLFMLTLLAMVARADTIVVAKGGNADYTKIQDAIDNATEEDTIRVWEGIYSENVVVDKSVSLVGNGSANTKIDAGRNDDGVTITDDGVDMSGFYITAFGSQRSGIAIKSNNNTITNNTCSARSGYGISLESSNSCIIENNTCSTEYGYGIYLEFSDSCTITNNTCRNNDDGIYLEHSGICTIENNTCLSNYGRDIHLEYSDACTITNNICKNNGTGIFLGQSNSCSITDNTCTYKTYGIRLFTSSSCIIGANICSDNQWDGIYISTSYPECTIMYNICTNNKNGIYLKDSSVSTIEYNDCSMNNENGIYLQDSNDCTIEHNDCSSNNENGIYLQASSNCILTNNSFMKSYYGIFLDTSSASIMENNTISENVIGINLGPFSLDSIAHYNNIFNNQDYGINSTIPINATHNKWGYATGPYHPTKNPLGEGDRISENVLFEPWVYDQEIIMYLPDNDQSGNDDTNSMIIILYLMLAVMGTLFLSLIINVLLPDKYFVKRRSGKKETGKRDNSNDSEPPHFAT